MKSDNPFDRLGPIDWTAHPALADADADALDAFLADTFASAQLLIDSIPAPMTARSGMPPVVTGRPRAQTDGAVSYRPSPAMSGVVANGATPTDTNHGNGVHQMQSLRGGWKEVRVNNPRHVAVFKHTAGRDGYGGSSWFARRSVHQREVRGTEKVDLTFDVFRRGLLKEFGLPDEEETPDEADAGRDGETKADNRANTSSKACKVRTMEVARHLEGRRCSPDSPRRALHVFQLQAQFPRPTAARDFVTMLLTEHATLPSSSSTHAPRQFMVVSKPCAHPAAPPRPGYVRAEYESVEVVREVPVPVATTGEPRKTRSSMDLSTEDVPHEMAIEWLMITRNNPGGNVPRFLVDRSTPSSIVNDANRFLDWLVQQA